METIKFRDVTFSYPLSERNALDGISFGVNESEFIVVCGKSGCGKSTLLKHMKKNLIPYGNFEGEITYGGENITELEDRKSAAEIGFVQQNPDNQIVTDKVWHELAFGLENLGLDNLAIKRRVSEMASYFDIQAWFRKDVSQLSGGQKQLLNLSSIMTMQPKLLILDEPTSQLDPIAASEFLQTLHKINRDLGTTVILSEHRLEEAFTMADKVMVMDEGRVIAFDTPRNIGQFLGERKGKDKHPMFYGLPSVMKIYQDTDGQGESPLTIREGRLWLESLTKDKDIVIPEDLMLAAKADKKKDEKIENPIIEIKDLWFKYDQRSGEVLRGLNLQVEKGQLFCVLGGNGVGKSTTLKAISGMIKPQRGKIQVDGISVKKENLYELFDNRLAMLPQNPQALFTEITVEEELLEAMHYMKLDDDDKIQNVEDMLDLMELRALRKSHPYDLSGGEQQRLALGVILLLNPKIILLDEATKGLDPFFKRTLAKILRKLVDDGVTIFMVSHDIEFCAEYADKCAMFFDGSIVSVGTPREFFSGNNFYTTSANKISREWCPSAITYQEVSKWIKATV